MRVPRKAISKTLPGNGPGLFLPLWLAAASAHFWWSEPAADEIAGAFAEAQKRTDSVRGMIADEPDIATDAYVRLGLATVKRFTHPIPGGPAGKETD